MISEQQPRNATAHFPPSPESLETESSMSEKNPVKDSTEKAAPSCDCGFRECNGKTVLNGVRFVCENGQYTYEHHIDDFPVYAAAPSLYAALKNLLTSCDEQAREFDASFCGNWDHMGTCTCELEAAHAVLALVDGKPCHDCGKIRQLREYEKDNLAGTAVLHIELCSDCYAERTE